MEYPTKISKLEHSMLSEDGTLKYDFMTSLQKIAMAKIAITVWMNQNTQQEIVKFYQQCCYKGANIPYYSALIGRDICAKIWQLSLPISIRQELRDLAVVLKDFIFNWINYHNEHIFSTKESEFSAEHLIHNIAWTSRGKIDYLQTAKNILANTDSGLSDGHKYKLACIYCLEDEIAVLSSKLVNEFHLINVEISKYPMVYFWTAHITGDKTRLNYPPYYGDRNRPCVNTSFNEHVMQLLIKIKVPGSDTLINDVPMKFMWNKLSEEEKAKNIARLFEIETNSDFLIYLLSKLDYDQQQNILKDYSGAILCGFLKEWWWWGKYFVPTTINILDIMDPLSFWRVLNEINLRKQGSSQKKMYDLFKSLLKWLWQEVSVQLKEFVIQLPVWTLKDFVKHRLNLERDIDVIEVIFKDLNKQEKKSIVFDEVSIRTCASYIKLFQLDVVDMFIKCAFSSEEDVNQLKHRLIQHSGKEIATSFLKEREFHKMQCFMNWAFKSEEEMTNFRQSLNYTIQSLT